ncbi:MAG: 3'-5' exonuclease [Gammaproteobacteria bacterium]|nr:3'-5' exonuclease [Gammaproteobacteria bacterium]
MNVFVFDIETVPDFELGRKLYDLDPVLKDADVASIMFQKRREETGESEFLRHHMHRIVAISAVFRHGDSVKVWSLGDPDSDEKELVRRFFDGIDRYTPTLVSWNGSGFDLPVLHYRALKHGVVAGRYWDTGEDDRDFKWNNYISRYHQRHTDLMDVLAAYQARANAPLDQIALMLGLPGKMGMSGSKVCDQFIDGNIIDIRNYCETDVLNTYLVYLRWLLTKGQLTEAAWQQEIDLVRVELRNSGTAHLLEFLEAWEQG